MAAISESLLPSKLRSLILAKEGKGKKEKEQKQTKVKQDYQKLLVNATGYEHWIQSPAYGELSATAVFGKQRSQENSLLLTENWTGSKSHESCSVPTLHPRIELVSTCLKENEKPSLKDSKTPFRYWKWPRQSTFFAQCVSILRLPLFEISHTGTMQLKIIQQWRTSHHPVKQTVLDLM